MNIPSVVLTNLWILFMIILAGGCVEGCRRLLRRERIARGGK